MGEMEGVAEVFQWWEFRKGLFGKRWVFEIWPEEGRGACCRREFEFSGGGEGLLVVAVGFDNYFGGF